MSFSARASALYEEHFADATRLAFLLTGDPHAAEDLAQEAFVRLFTRLHQLRRRESFPFYLRRTIVNLSRDRFRKLQRERAFAERERTGEPALDQTPLSVVARDELVHALLRLPIRQRTAVVLRYCDDLSEHETARLMDTSSGAVNSLSARGLATLRTLLKGESDG